MITTKEYDDAITKASKELEKVGYDTTLDYKDTCEAVSKITLELYNLTLMFIGQENM